MSAVTVWGLVAIVGALVVLVLGLGERRKRRAMAATETLRCDEIERRRGELAAGMFSTVCEVAGRAAPGPAGTLAAPFSSVQCIWHRSVVTRRYWERKRDRDGDVRRVERTKVVAEHRSPQPFTVDDGSGTIAVELGEERPEGDLEQVHSRFEREEGAAQASSELASLGRVVEGLAGSKLGGGGLLSGGDITLGYHFEEWVVRPGQDLYVLGEASDRSGTLSIGKPEKGHFLVSTKGEKELAAEARGFERFLYGVAVVLLALGAGLVVAAAS